MNTNITKQPPTLKVYFATEMWERYGFYVVQTLLALYLSKHFIWDDSKIFPLVGAFTALTYLSPVIGGWIADKLLGQKVCVLTGSSILFLSYLLLGSLNTPFGLTIALAGIAVGTGLLKPNISSLLGNEYKKGSENRENGFTIFYMGITTGIILGTTLPSILEAHFGWSYAFLSSCIGLIIAILVFSFGIKIYKIKNYSEFQHNLKDICQAFTLIASMWVCAVFILESELIAEIVFLIIASASIFYVISAALVDDKKMRNRTFVIGILCLISIMFWSFYFQMFMSLTLFIERVISPKLFGISFPPPYYVAVQSIGMILFGTLLSYKKKQAEIITQTKNVGNKFTYSMLLLCLAYLIITLVAKSTNNNILLHGIYLIPAYLTISLSELLLSPVGLSAITVLANPHQVSTMMGIFFVSLGVGGFLSGRLSNLTAIKNEVLNTYTVAEIKSHYATVFTTQLKILLAGVVICFALNILIKKLMDS